MNAFLALILLGQTGGDLSISDSVAADRFVTQPPAAVDTSVEDGSALPPLEPTPAPRPASRTMLTADSPANRPRPSQAFGTGATQRGVIQATIPAVSQETQYATTILENMLTLDEEAQTKVRKVKLVEAVSQSMDVQNQAIAIGAYWDLAMHIGRLRFAQDKVAVLSTVQAPNDPAERANLDAAFASAEVNEATAQDQLLAAQYRLVRTATIAAGEQLPWPTDIPLVGAYRTNYETFFAQRTAPLEIKHIHQSLPGKLKLIERCTAAVIKAETAMDATVANYKQGRSPLAALLESTERLERARNSFLTAVVDYNDRIAEYSLAAVGPSIGPETLVTTLIKAPSAATNMATIPRDVRQANVETAPAAPVGAFNR
jgi:hypothetical protein